MQGHQTVGYLLVFIGSGIGGVLRYGVNLCAARWGALFPWATLLVNVVGCFAMGLVAGWLVTRGPSGQAWRLFMATGVLGGFTTFSAFSLEVLQLWERNQPGQAVVYVLASVCVSIVAVAAGIWVSRPA